MNLSNTKVYLCGQIENDPEAMGWRLDLARRLPLINPTISVWDPMVKPEWVHPDIKNNEMAFAWKQYINSNPSDEWQGEMCHIANKKVRRICKQLANKCDWMIARICKKFTWGSIDELEIAINRKIPVFLWLPDGLISIYGIAGVIEDYSLVPYYMHEDMESLLTTISDVDKGISDLLKKDPETWMTLSWTNAASETNNA